MLHYDILEAKCPFSPHLGHVISWRTLEGGLSENHTLLGCFRYVMNFSAERSLQR